MTSSVFATAALAAALGLAAAHAHADGLVYQLKTGLLAHDVPELWSGFRRETSSADINIEAELSPSMTAFFGTIRPAVGGTINTDGQTSHVYVDARWTIDLPRGFFFATGLGGAIHDGNVDKRDPDRKALGSRVLFHVPIEVGYHFDAHNAVSAYFEHTSNGYTMRYNEGLDRVGIRYGYTF